MSKIAILLCVMVVASLDASAKDSFEFVENEIETDIKNGLDAFKTEYISMIRIVQENIDKLIAQYNQIIIKIQHDTLDYAVMALEKLNDIMLNTSEECDIKNNCSFAFAQIMEKSHHLLDSMNACAEMAVERMYNNTYVSEATAQYAKAYSDLMEFKKKPLCSSQYDKTTQLDLIETCNEMLRKQVNEEINKNSKVFANIKDTKNLLPTLLNDVPDCGNGFNVTAYQAEVDVSSRKTKTCYEQCQLDEQLETSAAAK